MARSVIVIGLTVAVAAIGACSAESTPPPVFAEPPSGDQAEQAATHDTPTPERLGPPPTETQLPPPYGGPFELGEVPEASSARDIQPPFSLPSAGFLPVAFVANEGSAQLGELDVFEMRDRVYVVQRRSRGSYAMVDVTDPANPNHLGSWRISPPTTGEHIRAFRQSNRWYLVLPLELDARLSAGCGLAIIEITDPLAPILRDVHSGATTRASENWCQVHSVEVVADDSGNATFMLVTSWDTKDLRVLDVRDLKDVREVNVYHPHVHPHGKRAWTHGVNVVGDRVYVSIYDGGVMILNLKALVAGGTPESVELTALGAIASAEFSPHDAYPSASSDFLFANDAFLSDGGLRLFDIRDLENPRPVMIIDPEGLKSQRHTLLVQDELLIVPWRTNGVRVYKYDFSSADNPSIELVAFQEVREQPRDTGSGVNSVASHPCSLEGVVHHCVFASDETQGLIILALDDD